MKIEKFIKLFETNNAISITEDLILFNDMELYSFSKREGKQYKNIYELCEERPDILRVIEETEDFTLVIHGGRGASSGGLSGKMGGGFSHAGSGYGNGDFGKTLLNATLNVNTNKQYSIDGVLERFRQKYGDAQIEYGIAVDDLGYVYNHKEGDSASVAIWGMKGQTIIHNHPSGGNFSDADLLSTAMTHEKGIIATSSATNKVSTYRFEKTQKFKSKEFIKAVKKAKWPVEYSYDKGADWWLSQNQQKYGYKYSATGVPKK